LLWHCDKREKTTDLIEVQGYADLARDSNSNAIVNTNFAAYEAAIRRSKITKKKNDDLRDAIRDINILKNEMKEIRSLLLKMVENTNGKS